MTTKSEYQTGIVGAGWLGLPLARVLQAEGRQVAVTVSSAQKAAQLTAEGLQAWPLQLGTGLTALPFRCRELVICVPPSKVEDYPTAIGRVAELARAAGVQRLLFVSATSVWAPGQGRMNTPCLPTSAGCGCWPPSRRRWGLAFPVPWCCAPAGCTGHSVIPPLPGGQNPGRGGQAVNLVHLDDVVAACQLLLAQGKDGDAYNLSAPVHPRREQFYPFAARQLGLPAPVFIEPVSPRRGAAHLRAARLCLSLARSGALVCRAGGPGSLSIPHCAIEWGTGGSNGVARRAIEVCQGGSPYHAAIHTERAVKMVDTRRHPDGELLLRTLAMPADTNPNGDIFGAGSCPRWI